jgi:hypothetical protein
MRARSRILAVVVMAVALAGCDEHIPPDLSGDGGDAEAGDDGGGDAAADVSIDTEDAPDGGVDAASDAMDASDVTVADVQDAADASD